MATIPSEVTQAGLDDYNSSQYTSLRENEIWPLYLPRWPRQDWLIITQSIYISEREWDMATIPSEVTQAGLADYNSSQYTSLREWEMATIPSEVTQAGLADYNSSQYTSLREWEMATIPSEVTQAGLADNNSSQYTSLRENEIWSLYLPRWPRQDWLIITQVNIHLWENEKWPLYLLMWPRQDWLIITQVNIHLWERMRYGHYTFRGDPGRIGWL